MQPHETLRKVPEDMLKCLTEKTYGKQKDPDLFTKIGNYLLWVKKPKNVVLKRICPCLKRPDANENKVLDPDPEENVELLEVGNEEFVELEGGEGNPRRLSVPHDHEGPNPERHANPKEDEEAVV